MMIFSLPNKHVSLNRSSGMPKKNFGQKPAKINLYFSFKPSFQIENVDICTSEQLHDLNKDVMDAYK